MALEDFWPRNRACATDFCSSENDRQDTIDHDPPTWVVAMGDMRRHQKQTRWRVISWTAFRLFASQRRNSLAELPDAGIDRFDLGVERWAEHEETVSLLDRVSAREHVPPCWVDLAAGDAALATGAVGRGCGFTEAALG